MGNGCPLQETCIAPGLDCPVAPVTGPACAFMAAQPEKYQDRICDDELNTPECNYDGGDCCVHKVDNWNERCTACECLGLNFPKRSWEDGEMVKNVKASGTKLDASMMVEIVARTPMVKNAKMILLSSKRHKVHKSLL